MGLSDEVDAAIARERDGTHAHHARMRQAKDRELALLADFVAEARARQIPMRSVTIVHERDAGFGRFLRELVGMDSVAYARGETVSGWGPIVSYAGEYSNDLVVVTPDATLLNVTHLAPRRGVGHRAIQRLERRGHLLSYRSDSTGERPPIMPERQKFVDFLKRASSA